MNPDDIRQQIELQIVELIKDQLARGVMTEERAQQISQRVLDIIRPGMSMEELYRAIPKLDDTCQELSPVILPFLRQYEENVNKKALSEIENMIRQGQYDAAASLGKQVVNQEVKLMWTGAGKPVSSVTPASVKAKAGKPDKPAEKKPTQSPAASATPPTVPAS
jgi:hypothetical protein